MDNSKRINWIDYVKTLAIVLVVLYHSEFLLCKLLTPILAMCVPLFFVSNGVVMLSKRREIDYYIKKIFKILFLLFFWSILQSSCRMIIDGDEVVSINMVKNAFSLKMGYSHTLWFLYTLINLYTIYPMITHFVVQTKNSIFLFVLTFLLSFKVFGYTLPLGAIPNFLCGWQSYSLFYAIGGLLIFQIPIQIKKRYWTYLIAAFVVFWFTQLIMFSGISFFSKHTPTDLGEAVFGLYRSPFVMGMTLLAVLTIKNTCHKGNNIVAFVSKHTLGIYVLHPIIMGVLRVVIPLNGNVKYCLLFVFSFSISLFISYLMSKSKYTKFLISI